MFTGIVEEVGHVTSAMWHGESYRMAIRATKVLDGTKLGDSIAVEGVCLTVSSLSDDRFEVGLAPETLSRSTLGSLSIGDGVNLERSLTPDSRMGGHVVQGHIDGTGVIKQVTTEGDSVVLKIALERQLMRYVVSKGFVAVDGVSLTVIEADDEWFTLMLVAYTQDHVTLSRKQPGNAVNIEVDILAKYVERLVETRVTL